MNRALIDTDILSYYFKGDKQVCKQFESYLKKWEIIEISIVTFYEIVSGLKAKNAHKQLEQFEQFANDNLVIPVTEKSASISAKLYAQLKQKGTMVDDIDLLIAGIAIENEMVLVTNNQKHFGRIEGLNVVNWK
jgi:tRNA(fMet)-specific endonuclease VapC